MLVKASAWSLTITNSINQSATEMQKIKTPEANYSQLIVSTKDHVKSWMFNEGYGSHGQILLFAKI